MKPRVLIATGIFPPDIGGPALYSQKLAEEFSGRGLVALVITYGKSFQKSDAYLVIGVSRRWPFGLRQLIYFLKLFNQARKFDAILAFDSLGAGLPAVIAGKILSKRVIIRLGGDFLWEKFVESSCGTATLSEFYEKRFYRNFPLLYRLINFTLRQAAVVAFTTEFQKKIFLTHYGLNPNKVFVISNIFSAKGGSAFGGKKESGDSPTHKNNPKIILWAGRFLKLKNLDFLLKVFERLIAYDKNLVLEMVGDGPQKNHIIEAIQLEGLAEKVKISGTLSESELRKRISSSYFCILPSLSEVSPNFALHCLSLNKPIILTEETGLKEQFPELIYADPQREDSFFMAAFRMLDGDAYDNYQKFISSLRYQKTWKDLAEEYLKIFNSY